MKLESVRTHISEPFDIPGLLTGKIDYSIKTGTSTIQWVGPKIDVQLWHAVLKFFKDTYDASKSECQVRLYCHARDCKWVAWAFPQEARSYMSAREVNNQEAQEQRAMFKDEEGWQYLGTVHHHCSTSAFQSGTDRDNEKGQDGLHITIGKLDSQQYDIHARFYLAGAEFVPDMSAFWDIGNYARTLLPADCHDRIARHQMTIPAPGETVYPDVWKKNLIEIKAVQPLPYHGHAAGFQAGGSGNGSATGNAVSYGSGNTFPNETKRKEIAFEQMRRECAVKGISKADMDAAFQMLDDLEIFSMMRVVCARNHISISDLVAEWSWEKDMIAQYGENWPGSEMAWGGCP